MSPELSSLDHAMMKAWDAIAIADDRASVDRVEFWKKGPAASGVWEWRIDMHQSIWSDATFSVGEHAEDRDRLRVKMLQAQMEARNDVIRVIVPLWGNIEVRHLGVLA